MSLENIINYAKEKANKIKEIAQKPISLKEAVLYAGLTILPVLTACENRPIISPLGPQINSQTVVAQGIKYSGQATSASVQPLETPFQKVEGRYMRPGETWTPYQELQDTNSDGKYEIAIASTPSYGGYAFQFATETGGKRTESQQVLDSLNMNEPQSDAALQAIITPLVKPASTTDGDIIAANFNQNYFFGGHLYNNDAVLTIYDSAAPPGNQRDYIVDIQGSEGDNYNSQKKTDADNSAISYVNIGNFDSYSGLENTLNNLQNQKWARTNP